MSILLPRGRFRIQARVLQVIPETRFPQPEIRRSSPIAVFKLKRIYESFEAQDGYRVLVDRIWPRGMSKETARIKLWMKEIGPSDALRKWFGHNPVRWPEFQKRYRRELKKNTELIDRLRELDKKYGTVTLLYSARDDRRNQAVVLCAFLRSTRS
ncbi:MAG: DUF488 domain-containing protein [Candidatus Acidiferrales bacterium]